MFKRHIGVVSDTTLDEITKSMKLDDVEKIGKRFVWTYIMHFGKKLVSADSVDFSKGSTTAVWKWNVGQIMMLSKFMTAYYTEPEGIGYNEELWLKAGGNGGAFMAFTIPRDTYPLYFITDEDTKNEFNSVKGVFCNKVYSLEKGGYRIIYVRCLFDNFSVISQLASTTLGKTGVFGSIRYQKQSNGTMSYSRVVSVPSGDRDYRWTYAIRLPGAIVSANQNDSRQMTHEKRSVNWSFELSSPGEQRMEAISEVRSKKSLYSAIVLILIGMAILSAALLIYKKGNRLKD